MRHTLAAVMILLALPAAAQMDTAAQVKPILQMTKGNWIAVREFNGQDLLYFTHLEVFRCGLERITYALNYGAAVVWDTPPCPGDDTFSEIPADRQPYAVFALGSIETVRVELVYDDGTSEAEVYERGAVLGR